MTNVSQLKNLTQKRWFYPVVLLLIGSITYGYVLTSLGYYWADWEIVMFTKLNQALQFRFYAHDRPFPWTYHLLYFLLGSKPVGWHVATLLIRWAGVLFFVQALILVWPRYKNHMYWLGVLLLVYPGFLQQSQSATKSRHITTFLLFAISIYFMVLAVRRPKSARWAYPLSWLAAFVQLFTTEYFSGMELIRPIILWIVLSGEQQSTSQTLRRVLKIYLPYLIITVFYFWCRFVYFPIIFQTTSRISDIERMLAAFQDSLIGGILGLFNKVTLDLIYSTLQVWVNAVLHFEGFTFQSRVAWFAFGAGLVLTLAFAFFYSTREDETARQTSPLWMFILGFVAFGLGGAPIWAIGKDISGGGWSDRFALAPMIGACLMVMALILWLVNSTGQKYILGALMVFSIAAQIWMVNVYRNDWRTQLDYYWQLYWRAPSIQPGTALFSFEQPSPFVTHHSDAGFALNVLYHYQTENGNLPYWFFSRQYHFNYVPDDLFDKDFRGLHFDGNTSKGIAILHQAPNSCLRVLDTIYVDDPILQGRDVLINVSNPSRILPDPDAPPPDPDIFGQEPEHDWCYYFEKGDLARQVGDWKTAIALYKESQEKGLAASFGSEYIPFIEAYAQTADWANAAKLTQLAQKTNSGHKKILCNTWSRYSTLPLVDMNVVDQVKQSLACSN
jgi:hypothetical protein